MTRRAGAGLCAGRRAPMRGSAARPAMPYINHCCEVAELVAEAGAPDDDGDRRGAARRGREDRDHAGGGRGRLRAGGRARVAALTDPPEWAALPPAEAKARQAGRIATRRARGQADQDRRPDLEDARHRARAGGWERGGGMTSRAPSWWWRPAAASMRSWRPRSTPRRPRRWQRSEARDETGRDRDGAGRDHAERRAPRRSR